MATLKPSKFLKLQSVGLEFRSFESAITSVVLARKDDIVLPKPIKHPCFIENLRKISTIPRTVSALRTSTRADIRLYQH